MENKTTTSPGDDARERMTEPKPDESWESRLEQIIGYLNFSTGSEDFLFLRNLDAVSETIAENAAESTAVWKQIQERLQQTRETLEEHNSAFRDTSQAKAVLELVFDHVLPMYRDYHRDLLFHRDFEAFFDSFFLGRVFEIALQQVVALTDAGRGDGPADSPPELAVRVVEKLNDFIGHRPVAALESQKLQPYDHEWVRPIPVYIRGAGCAYGTHREIIQLAVDLLTNTDEDLLDLAQFDPELMDELAIDPRAFDFEHPVNKRPNYHFGQWDEHFIDNKGYYRRFVIHQVTLDALASRVDTEKDGSREELVLEAASVLAGTILMASGISGRGPGSYDSTVSLGDLLPIIASYRDLFYTRLLEKIEEPHRTRLLDEANRRQQPFGGARQHLNRQLARNRAFQMIHIHLALVFSRMGYEKPALRHAQVLPVASARMICQIDCLLHAGQQAIEEGELNQAAETIPRLFDILKRAVECGAVVDPWNILGFDANYNLFHGTENTVRDQRVDELVELMEQLFGFSAQVWIAAEAADESSLSERINRYFGEVVAWWRKFAVHEVSSVDSTDAQEIYNASENVAKVLNLWHKTGAERGDVAFWAKHADLFNSPRAYILAIEVLIEQEDYLTSMALLIHWLSQSDKFSLQQSSRSFQQLFSEWIEKQRSHLDQAADDEVVKATWERVRKFYDYLEANAGAFWDVPKFDLAHPNSPESTAEGLAEDAWDDDDSGELFSAAYEDMVYRETSDDGFDGAIFETGDTSDEDLQQEVERIGDHLEFLEAVALYWTESAMLVNQVAQTNVRRVTDDTYDQQKNKVGEWLRQAQRNYEALHELVNSIQAYALPNTNGSVDSLAVYDRHRLFKESLLDQAINVTVTTAAAMRMLAALFLNLESNGSDEERANAEEWIADRIEENAEEGYWTQVLAAILKGDHLLASKRFDDLIAELYEKPLLYVPLSKGGAPLKIVEIRIRQNSIGNLLECLPRLGLLSQTRELIQACLIMERNQKVRQGAVTEFDELFRLGYTSIVKALIVASNELAAQLETAEDTELPPAEDVSDDDSDDAPASTHEVDDSTPASDESGQQRRAREIAESSLFDCLEALTESMLLIWLGHSQTLRLSVLEKVKSEKAWQRVVDFIIRFGDQLLTQRFLNLSNIRAILHQGVECWLEQLDESQDEFGQEILEQLEAGYSRKDFVRYMTIVLEAVIENFNEYRDYNCTTTQSDNGRLLYILLDFLRLRARYEQVCWNLKPVIWAHEVLVRQNQGNVARLWRRLLTERVYSEADRFERLLREMQEKYSIQMATVSQRISERFVQPMQIDRLVSLVRPAMRQPGQDESNRAFELIEQHAEAMIQQPVGVGFELPTWIAVLEDEVERVINARFRYHPDDANDAASDYMLPPLEELKEQIRQMPRRHPS